MIRRIFLLLCTGGGVWGAIYGLQMIAERMGSADEFTLSGEGALLAIPIGMAGALVGALIGGILFPTKN